MGTSKPLRTKYRFPACFPACGAGFSLIELLVVISIIAILASLLLASIQIVKKQASKLTCMSNVRSIGLAITGYTNENEGVLPGPMGYGQKHAYTDSSMNLPMYLAIYLDAPEPTATARVLKPFACSEYLRRKSSLSYMTFNGDPDLAGAKHWPPFGRYAGPTSIWNRPPFALSEIPSPSTLWAMKEVDRTNVLPTTGWWPEIPPGPVHGMNRTILYFDFRADSIAASSDAGIY